MDYEDFEKECEQIRNENEQLISEFKTWLANKSLAPKTIEKHVANVDFYINTFLLYEEPIPAKEGAVEINMFLGYWFIRKAMWASSATIKENAASIKKFYQFMCDSGKITAEDLSDLKESIKEDMPEWLATLERYDDPDIEDMEEIWGF